MDLYATLAQPITAVFQHVADPSRLGDWLGEVADVEAGAATAARSGAPEHRPQGASGLPTRPAPPYRVTAGCCPRCARLRQHAG